MRSQEGESPKLVLRYHESSSTTELVLRKPTTRYFDQFLSLRCAVDLITHGLFPNAKEITESLAAVRAVFLHSRLDRKDSGIQVVCVGDGGTPRTAAALAFRTEWRCHSVDPLLNRDRIDYWEGSVRRLRCYPTRIEQASFDFQNDPVLIVAVHAHIELAKALEEIRAKGGDVVAAVAIPCCGFVHDAPGLELQARYDDWGIWSERRTVKAWAKSDR